MTQEYCPDERFIESMLNACNIGIDKLQEYHASMHTINKYHNGSPNLMITRRQRVVAAYITSLQSKKDPDTECIKKLDEIINMISDINRRLSIIEKALVKN